ncbi:DoxX family protein [Rivibacter subsaxonicus]|uniref:Putative oxidoreductase n=1 Tax=Rivibacter subsaxonicus TaxID=457575 RepID=A0A4Q7VNX7_9BURK|nr:DoxX family protein [Rivibacter subsaxonicus]RZT97934.1 putative oxidoreductase [Rivibacter subsaxonicus]
MNPIPTTSAALHVGTPGVAGSLLRLWEWGVALLGWLQAPALLAARIYVGLAFFRSGLTKIVDWETTLALFQDEYHVPLLPTGVAAVMGTAGELVLPVLLVLGLAGRFGALGLSVVNAIAVLSLAEIAPAALGQHHLWGALLAVVALWGPGKWSLDHLLWPRLRAWLRGRAA